MLLLQHHPYIRASASSFEPTAVGSLLIPIAGILQDVDKKSCEVWTVWTRISTILRVYGSRDMRLPKFQNPEKPLNDKTPAGIKNARDPVQAPEHEQA